MKKFFLFPLLFCCITFVPVLAQAAGPMEVVASWYALDGHRMANGQVFRSSDPTEAALRGVPLGTKVLVRNPANGRSLVVIVKDRGPFVKGRQLDLSRAAAKRLGYVRRGIARLTIVVL